MRLLYVEDDLEAQAFVSRTLQDNGIEVDSAETGRTGLDLALGGGYDVILLDVMLPGISGFEILKTLRDRGDDTPVLFLTAQGEVPLRIEGLNLGADDYLAKPFAFAELLARIRAVVRRRATSLPPESVTIADLVLEPGRRAVFRAGTRIELTPKEFMLLEYLMQNAGQAVSRAMITERIWGYAFQSYSNAIDVHVNHLRRKIDRGFEPKLIHTIKGVGYVVEDRSAEAGPASS